MPCHTLDLWDLSWIQNAVGNTTVCCPDIECQHEFTTRAVIWLSGNHCWGIAKSVPETCFLVLYLMLKPDLSTAMTSNSIGYCEV
jgi:hypothetical protein